MPFECDSLVVYYTDRQNVENCRFSKDEPFYIGPLIQRWLGERLKLEISPIKRYQPGHVLCLNYAEGKKEIEGHGRDYPIFRSVAERIEAPLRMAGQFHPNATLHISALGGIKPVNRLMEIIGSLFFTGEVKAVPDTEARREKLDTKLNDKAVSAEQSYQIRSQCITLLKRGDFVGAWGIAKELSGDLSGDGAWIDLLERLALLVDGQWRPPARGSESFPEKLLLSSRLNFCPRTLLLTLRINAALSRNSLADAMALTANLPDAALLDGVSRFLMIQSSGESGFSGRLDALLEEDDFIDAFHRRLDLQKSASAVLRKKIMDILKGQSRIKRVETPENLAYWPLDFKWNSPQAAPCVPKRGGANKQPDVASQSFALDPSANAWLALIDEPEYSDELPELTPALLGLCQRLFQVLPETERTLFDIGRSANGTLTDTQALAEARRAFLVGGIWIEKENSCRLSPKLAASLLAAFGVRDQESICDQLQNLAISAMRHHVMR